MIANNKKFKQAFAKNKDKKMAIEKYSYGYLNTETGRIAYKEMLEDCFSNKIGRLNLILEDIFNTISENRWDLIYDTINHTSDFNYIYKAIKTFVDVNKILLRKHKTFTDKQEMIDYLNEIYEEHTMIFHELYKFLAKEHIIVDRY